jgi:hypothetical protein
MPTATRIPSHRAPMLAIIFVSHLMIVLEISIVNTALPEIDQGLGFSYLGRGCGSKWNPRRVIHRLLIPPRTQYGATACKPKTRKSLKYTDFASLSKPPQRVSDHS